MVETACEGKRSWFLVDAEGIVLGRLATRVATILRGKHKRTFSPHLDGGDHVVVVNAQKVHLTGRKGRDKLYRTHSGYIGSLREVTADQMLQRHPERVGYNRKRGQETIAGALDECTAMGFDCAP